MFVKWLKLSLVVTFTYQQCLRQLVFLPYLRGIGRYHQHAHTHSRVCQKKIINLCHDKFVQNQSNHTKYHGTMELRKADNLYTTKFEHSHWSTGCELQLKLADKSKTNLWAFLFAFLCFILPSNRPLVHHILELLPSGEPLEAALFSPNVVWCQPMVTTSLYVEAGEVHSMLRSWGLTKKSLGVNIKLETLFWWLNYPRVYKGELNFAFLFISQSVNMIKTLFQP